MKNTIISLGLFKDSGGPTKTVDAFKSALVANLYCFCSPDELLKNELAIEGAYPVVSSKIPLLRELKVVSAGKSRAAETALAESNVISAHSFYRYHALWVNRMSRKYGVPYWFVPHGILDPWVMERGRIIKEAYWRFGGKQFLDEASTVIFSTVAERDKAASQFDLPDADIIPWPVDLIDLTYSMERRQIIRSQLGIPDDARVLLYFGRMHTMKCPLECIEALAESKGKELHLIMVGNAQDVNLEDCSSMAQRHGVAKRVHLIGPVYGDAKYDYLHASDAYLSLSYRENFNHTAAESLAAGLPVIMSSGNDLLSEIQNQHCAWALDGNSVASAVTAINQFAEIPSAELKLMGMRGRAWVETALSFENFRAKLLQVAQRIIHK